MRVATDIELVIHKDENFQEVSSVIIVYLSINLTQNLICIYKAD